jgi:CubicO group peptidase (beta-lactamase class C family)
MQAMDELHLPGVSLAIVQGGSVAFQKSYGLANVTQGRTLTPEALLGIASVTKMFTTVAILQLAEAKKLSLDEPFTKYLGGYPDTWSTITIRELLAMQSGIPDGTHGDDTQPGVGFLPWPEHVKWSAAQPLAFEPGTRAEYSNTNFLLLGQLIERVAGQSYEDFVRTNILAPLGMTSTRANATPPPPGMATGYVWDSGGFREAHYKPPLASFSAGWLVSNPVDLVRFDDGLRTSKLLTRESYDEMNTAQLFLNGAASTRGLGWDTVRMVGDKKFVVKGGELPGWRCVYIHGVDAPVSVIVQANRLVAEGILNLANQILDQALR